MDRSRRGKFYCAVAEEGHSPHIGTLWYGLSSNSVFQVPSVLYLLIWGRPPCLCCRCGDDSSGAAAISSPWQYRRDFWSGDVCSSHFGACSATCGEITPCSPSHEEPRGHVEGENTSIEEGRLCQEIRNGISDGRRGSQVRAGKANGG